MNPLKRFTALFSSPPGFTPAACVPRVRSGDALLVDVREPSEWASGVADRAHLLPLGDLKGSRAQWAPFLAGAAGREILLYCAAGGRANAAAGLLRAEGFRASGTGGLKDWKAAGWPLAKSG